MTSYHKFIDGKESFTKKFIYKIKIKIIMQAIKLNLNKKC